ncbi:hypothetical protein GCM10027020_21040 [Nocardioides salsibiostraticola]
MATRHDVGVNSQSSRRRATRVRMGAAVAGTALLAGVLTACSGSDPDEAEPTSGATASSSPSGTPGTATVEKEPYLEVPVGVELTEPGRALQIGETATVAWEPRQDQIGALDIEVTRVDKTSFKESFGGWKLDATTKKTTPYFVRARLTNVGATDLGERQVPLYLVDTNGTLIQPSRFQSRFAPCPSNPDFPKKFAVDKSEKFCLVYLAPEGTEFRSVSFRPTQEFNPITWNGQAKAIKQPKKKQKKSENETEGN